MTEPLWRLLKSDIHIRDLNKYYQQMAKLSDEFSVSFSEFVHGNICFVLFYLKKA